MKHSAIHIGQFKSDASSRRIQQSDSVVVGHITWVAASSGESQSNLSKLWLSHFAVIVSRISYDRVIVPGNVERYGSFCSTARVIVTVQQGVTKTALLLDAVYKGYTVDAQCDWNLGSLADCGRPLLLVYS